MSIDFAPDRWARVRQTYRRWWAHELERPLAPVTLPIRDPGRPQPDAPLLSQATCADFSWSPEALIDRIDYELARNVYLGDAFPYFNMDCFGPGVAGAFLGARLDNSSGRVWFYPPDERPIDQIHMRYDPNNPWLERVRALYAAGMKRWQGQVLMGMTDLGGNLDMLATFRPGERLLLDLYDHPEKVERLTWEAHEAWHRYYAELNEILQPVNPGYSDWSSIYSDQPSYILQCDFSYMISPKMFARFVRPELAASCRRLGNSFYHLDGVGQLPHLDQILAIKELGGVQWIHGDGKPDCSHWPEVYQKIVAADKLMQIYGEPHVLDAVIAQTGAPGRIHARIGWGAEWNLEQDAERQAREWLAGYGIE